MNSSTENSKKLHFISLDGAFFYYIIEANNEAEAIQKFEIALDMDFGVDNARSMKKQNSLIVYQLFNIGEVAHRGYKINP